MLRFFLFIFTIHTFFSTQLFAQQSIKNGIALIFERYEMKNNQAGKAIKNNQNGFYKKYISKQISANCVFKNSCSVFMYEAQQKLGFGKGFLLGIDRLSRCGTSESTYNYLPSLIWNSNSTLIDDLHFYE